MTSDTTQSGRICSTSFRNNLASDVAPTTLGAQETFFGYLVGFLNGRPIHEQVPKQTLSQDSHVLDEASSASSHESILS